MKLDIGSFNIEPDVELKEAYINREATSYLVDNYDRVRGIISTYNVHYSKVDDLLHDLYISLAESENNGEGFNSDYFEDDEKQITVQQFVLSRAKAFSYNSKYRTDCIDSFKSSSNNFELIAASFLGDNASENNVETTDAFQEAYRKAGVYDSSLEDIEDRMAIIEQIDYCVDICKLNNINLISFLKNLDELHILTNSLKKKSISDSILSALHDVLYYNDELCENLIDVVRYYLNNTEQFKAILENY